MRNSNQKRFTKSNPCPICNGYDNMERNKGKRCFGFLSEDKWAHCTRQEYAGLLPVNSKSKTYAHKLTGNCNCGVRHDPTPEKRITAQYDYYDENGELLYQVVRFEPKGFFQRRKNSNGEWIWGLNAGEYAQFPNGEWRSVTDKTPQSYPRINLTGTRRVLYKLPQLLAADQQQLVYIVEGEKDVEKLISLGLVATTNAGGAEKWREEYSEHLQGRHVVILPDNDETGRKHAEQIAASLLGKAASVKIIELPGLPEKGDVSDWLNLGNTIEQLSELVSNIETETKASSTENPNSSNSSNLQKKLFPMLSDKALLGLPGEIVRRIEPHTEAHPVALLINLLATFGNYVGFQPYYQSADKQGTNLFTVIVAPTGRAGRKGTSWTPIKHIFEKVDADFIQNNVQNNGLASGEGLITRLRDANDDDEGVLDKRLLLIIEEFNSVLTLIHRKDSILKDTLNNAADRRTLSTMRSDGKNSKTATNPHVSIVAHITNKELREKLRDDEKTNGFANRFFWFCAKRSKKLPHGGRFFKENIEDIVGKLKQCAEFAANELKETTIDNESVLVGELVMDAAANELWEEFYESLDETDETSTAAMLNRAEPYTLRFACIYALLDKSRTIRRQHLEAAIAVYKYAEQSVNYIFGNNVSLKAQKLYEFIKQFGKTGVRKSDMYRRFDTHIRQPELDTLLAEISDYVVKDLLPTAGRDEERYFAADSELQNSEFDEFDEESIVSNDGDNLEKNEPQNESSSVVDVEASNPFPQDDEFLEKLSIKIENVTPLNSMPPEKLLPREVKIAPLYPSNIKITPKIKPLLPTQTKQRDYDDGMSIDDKGVLSDAQGNPLF